MFVAVSVGNFCCDVLVLVVGLVVLVFFYFKNIFGLP